MTWWWDIMAGWWRALRTWHGDGKFRDHCMEMASWNDKPATWTSLRWRASLATKGADRGTMCPRYKRSRGRSRLLSSLRTCLAPGTWHLILGTCRLLAASTPILWSPLFLSHHPPAALTLFLIASCAHPCPAQVVAIVCKAGKTNRSTLVVDLSHLVPPSRLPC